MFFRKQILCWIYCLWEGLSKRSVLRVSGEFCLLEIELMRKAMSKNVLMAADLCVINIE